MGGYGCAFRKMRPVAELGAALRRARVLLLAEGVGLIGEVENVASVQSAQARWRGANTDAE